MSVDILGAKFAPPMRIKTTSSSPLPLISKQNPSPKRDDLCEECMISLQKLRTTCRGPPTVTSQLVEKLCREHFLSHRGLEMLRFAGLRSPLLSVGVVYSCHSGFAARKSLNCCLGLKTSVSQQVSRFLRILFLISGGHPFSPHFQICCAQLRIPLKVRYENT